MDNWISLAKDSKGLKLFEILALADLAETSDSASLVPSQERGEGMTWELKDLKAGCRRKTMLSQNPNYAESVSNGLWGLAGITDESCANVFMSKREASRAGNKWYSRRKA